MTSFGGFWGSSFDASGRMLSEILIRNPKATGDDAYRYMLERRSMAKNRADTLPQPGCVPPGTKPHGWSARSSQAGISMGVPYSASQSLAYSAQDYAWCAFGSKYIIYRLGLARGDTQLVIRGRAVPVPVTPAERDSAIASAKAAFDRINANVSAISWATSRSCGRSSSA